MRMLRVIGALIEMSIKSQVSFRFSMVFNGVLTVVGVGSGLFAVWAVFRHTTVIAGWTIASIIVLLGTFQFVGGLVQVFIEPNLAYFQGKVMQGQFDDILLTPLPTIFTASCMTINPWGGLQVLLGLIIVVGALVGIGHFAVSLVNILTFAFQVACGIVVAWAYRVLVASSVFWAPGSEPSVIYNAFWQFGMYPTTIYPAVLRNFLTYLVPVAFVSTFPALSLVHPVHWTGPVGSLVAGTLSFSVALLVWRAGTRRYTSATS